MKKFEYNAQNTKTPHNHLTSLQNIHSCFSWSLSLMSRTKLKAMRTRARYARKWPIRGQHPGHVITLDQSDGALRAMRTQARYARHLGCRLSWLLNPLSRTKFDICFRSLFWTVVKKIFLFFAVPDFKMDPFNYSLLPSVFFVKAKA